MRTISEARSLRRAGSFGYPGIRGEIQIAHQVEASVERRKGIRYRLNAPAVFRWSGPESGHHQAEGVTRDMSVAGAFVITSTCPPPNSMIQMEVVFPISDGAPKPLMKANMMVLRVESDIAGKKRSGFSAVSKGFSLSTVSERTSPVEPDRIKQPEANQIEKD